MTNIKADLVIIGGGIMGLCTALAVARRGRSVVVFERGTAMAEASGVNAGSLGVQNKLLPLVPYALEALAMWRRMGDDLGAEVGFRNAGGWRVATSVADREALHRSSEAQAKAGVEIRWRQGAPLRGEAPFLGPNVVAATHSPQDSYANPLLFATALRHAVSKHGVVLKEHREVLNIDRSNGWRVTTRDMVAESEQVVLATGAWTGRFLATLGAPVPLALDVNMISVTEPAGRLIEGIVFHVLGILTVKQIANGTCLIGGGWQGLGDLGGLKELDYESVLHNIRLAVQVLPDLRSLNVVRHWSGLEGVTPDSLPYFGEVPGQRDLYVCACVRGGWTLGPLFGRLMGELVCDGLTSLPTSQFSLLRHRPESRVA